MKDLSRLPVHETTRIENLAFEQAPNLESIREVPRAEKLHGYQAYFKIRFGHYRVGIHYTDNVLIFERALHRREIYRYFP